MGTEASAFTRFVTTLVCFAFEVLCHFVCLGVRAQSINQSIKSLNKTIL